MVAVSTMSRRCLRPHVRACRLCIIHSFLDISYRMVRAPSSTVVVPPSDQQSLQPLLVLDLLPFLETLTLGHLHLPPPPLRLSPAFGLTSDTTDSHLRSSLHLRATTVYSTVSSTLSSTVSSTVYNTHHPPHKHVQPPSTTHVRRVRNLSLPPLHLHLCINRRVSPLSPHPSIFNGKQLTRAAI